MPQLLYRNELDKLKRFRKDLDWFQANYASIKKFHKGEYVAIKEQQIIGHDSSAEALLRRLKQQYGNVLSSIVVEYVNERKTQYVL